MYFRHISEPSQIQPVQIEVPQLAESAGPAVDADPLLAHWISKLKWSLQRKQQKCSWHGISIYQQHLYITAPNESEINQLIMRRLVIPLCSDRS